MTQAIYATAAEAKETKNAQLAADIAKMCEKLKLTRCEAAVFGGHFADYASGRNGYDQTVCNVRLAKESLAETESNIAHLPGCDCGRQARATKRPRQTRDQALEELGLSPDATQTQIKRAYHDLARKYHPDSGGDADRMKTVNVAYATLTKE